ncbi:hypothetical protein BH09PLA1_BH09PLA1_12070 [soil metagenome]
MPESALVPRFQGNINFNAQHSPMGAFMSFTCGHFGTGGGIGVEIGRPANQNLFIGVKRGDRKSRESIQCLPFARAAHAPGAVSASDFHAGDAHAAAPSVSFYSKDEISRHYGWATDTWATPDFTFALHTPFGSIPEPTSDSDSLRLSILPAVIATLTVDNRNGNSTKTAVFAIDFVEPGARLLRGDDGGNQHPARVGFGWKRSLGVLGMIEEDEISNASASKARNALFAVQRWSVAEGLIDANPVHSLGTCAGLAFEVPAGEKRTLVLAIGAYLDGVVTTELEGHYFYTRSYASLSEVLHTALDHSGDLRSRANRLDTKLMSSGLSKHQQFLIAHSTRSYYGSTQLLEVAGQPFWVVNEGEYCMMNTLDLSIDHAFWELKHNPWVVRNLLDNFVRYYSYCDEIKLSRRGASVAPGGLSFSHDMGAHNNFSRFGTSSYELSNLTGCFSYMTQEQLCNWVLLAACYVRHTRDLSWLRKNRATIEACGQSMLNRGGEMGFAQYDSARCEDGAEITTYDSLDHSLAQTRNNLYIAVKCWATYLALEMMFTDLGDAPGPDNPWRQHAALVAETVVAQVQTDRTIPAVFEKDNPGFVSRILPAIEGLLYPLVWQHADALDPQGSFAAMLDALHQHTLALLKQPNSANFFEDGGIKLSSTSNNSWMSKIALFQHVARNVFEMHRDPEVKTIFERADAAHVAWQTDGSSFWACSDQFVSGVAKGSRYYPRIITTALWMEPAAAPASRQAPISATVKKP